MKKRVLVIMGGKSSENEISLISGKNIVNNIDKDKYEIEIIVINKEGEWFVAPSIEDIDKAEEIGQRGVLSPDTSKRGLIKFHTDNKIEIKEIDIVFPVLHGKNGEDGTIQGLLELSGIPYVGCGVLASAVSMDKWFTKKVIEGTGIKQAGFVPVYREELGDINNLINRIENTYPYPYFIKPANAGSSVGITKANTREELIEGLRLAAKYDRKILVEEMIVGRELECAVLGGDENIASVIGEILPSKEFYDYDAKYNSTESKTIISPELPEGVSQEIKRQALEVFKAVDGYGLSRVDFFLREDGEIIFNEINTLPGFTAISMYSMLFKASGIEIKELIEKLIETGFKRYEI